ncbi:hypothetical protein BGZ70_002930 [Mortierella alpina]|uniref:Uncharacterized protein n=1 Tax=Mortierella alpina TaxID=64518 RepID=A0A9P6IT91_MORAP|nr:hypothetical protein BGZ70_002930 [Mortierella alpina]
MSASTAAGRTSKKIPFWVQPGIVPFVDWLTDTENHLRFNKTTKGSGETSNELLDILGAYVEAQSGTDWTREQVKGKIQYAKKKLPGDQTLDIEESDPEIDEVEESESEDDIDVDISREQSIASSSIKGKAPASKRRKTERPKDVSVSDLQTLQDEIRAIRNGSSGGGSSGAGASIELDKERLRQMARREQVLEEREISLQNFWQSRWLGMSRALDERLKEREQECDDKLKKREQEHADALRRHTVEAESRLKRRRDEYETDWAELREMQSRFHEMQKSLLMQFVPRMNTR